MKLLLDSNSETHLMQGDATLRKQFEEHSIARTARGVKLRGVGFVWALAPAPS
jgi:hypothetical protein